MTIIAFLIFLYFLAALILKSPSSISKESRVKILTSLDEMLEKYSFDILKLYEKNIEEIKELLQEGQEEEANKKIENFKAAINNAVIDAKNQIKVEKEKI